MADNRLEGPQMSIRLLQEYIAFARVLSFSAAARQLYISQPTLTQHMQRLESALGAQLIDHGHRPGLTPAGKAFLQYAESIVCTYLEAVEDVRRLSRDHRSLSMEEPQGQGAILHAAGTAMDQLAATMPESQVVFRSIKGSTPLDALRAGEVDIVKTIAQTGDPMLAGVSLLPILDDGPVVWVRKDSELARQNSARIADLKDVPLLVPADVRYDDWRGLVRSWFRQRGLVPLFHLRVTETLTEFYMANPGDMAFILPGSLTTVESVFAPRNIVRVPIVDEGCRFTVSLAYLNDNENPILQPFLSYVQTALSQRAGC